MSLFRRDDYVQMAIGFAVPNAAVTYYQQVGSALILASIYNDANGDAPIANPQFTDGFGHAWAYMAAGTYTITYSGMQIETLTLPDQTVGGAGGAIPTFAGTPAGTVDGVNRVFTLTNNGTPLTVAPTQAQVTLNYPLVPGVGYTLSGVTVVYATAPELTDTIWAQGLA
jgi:hypothetical protein